MPPILTVCTHDARPLAEKLVRLLCAEGYEARLLVGRDSQVALAAAKDAKEAVLLIWSPAAPSQNYMRDWAAQIDPTRLIEVANAPGWPRIQRKAPVIDFAQWRGERGGRAWNTLHERLRAVIRALDPPQGPPRNAVLALGLGSVAAVGLAVGVRLGADAPAPAPPALETQTAHVQETAAMGGAVIAIEPASIEDLAAIPDVNPLRVGLLDISPAPELKDISSDPLPEVREPTLIERLIEFNPLGAAEDE
jgi:hypothetical protein